jgi:hypothetical protein
MMAAQSAHIAGGHYNDACGSPARAGAPTSSLSSAFIFNQMAERLEQTEALRSQLIGDVAHELRTPADHHQGLHGGPEDGVLPATTKPTSRSPP